MAIIEVGAEELPPNYLSEPLRQEIGLTWQANPLREGLMRVADVADVSIFLDRRCDPGQRITLETADRTLEEALWEIAGPLRLGVGSVGPVLYIGPSRTAATVATVTALRLAQAKAFPKEFRTRLLRRRTMSWPDLSEPRWLVEKLVAEVGCELANPEAIPHDLWWAGDLPPLNWVERMTLLLTGFRLTYDLDPSARVVRLRTYPSRTSIVHVYRAPGVVAEVAESLTKEFPQALVSVRNGQLFVRSTVEDHWKIATRLSGRGARTRGERGTERSSASTTVAPPGATKAYSLRIQERELKPLLDQLAQRLDLEIEFAEGIDEALQQRVSFEVEKVTAEQLLQAAVAHTGLVVTLEGRRVTVAAASP